MLIKSARYGTTSHKKKCLLSGNQGGREAPARKFWPSFHQVLIPKISQFLPKTYNICMFSGHFLHHYHQNHHYHHHNYHLTIIVIVGTFSVIRAKLFFLTSEKRGPSCLNKGDGGGGGGESQFGQCPKENILFYGRSSLSI